MLRHGRLSATGGAALGEKIVGVDGYEVFARSVETFQAGKTLVLALQARECLFRIDTGADGNGGRGAFASRQ